MENSNIPNEQVTEQLIDALRYLDDIGEDINYEVL